MVLPGGMEKLAVAMIVVLNRRLLFFLLTVRLGVSP
jgi:hypothetical protein